MSSTVHTFADMQEAVSHAPGATELIPSEVLVVAADPTVRAALVALCRTTTGRSVRDARNIPTGFEPGDAALLVVDPGDGTQGVARTVTAAAAFVVPVLVIPPAWRDALLAGALGDSARIVPEIAAVVAAALAAGAGQDTAPASLGARERAVVALVARGRTDDEIATELGIKTSTVRSHLDRIGQKTGARRRPAIRRLALRLGLTEDAPG